MPDTKPTIYTIGHSTHPLSAFVDLLRRHGVTALADCGIRYLFLGRELRARPAVLVHCPE